MGKKSSKDFKSVKKEGLEEKLLNFSEEEIEKLFEMGKINQFEYEQIINCRKKKKKKSQKEIFEERIRCNDTIIDKIIKLGKKFRRQESEYKKQETLNRMIEQESDIEREERIHTRSKIKTKERTKGGRGRDLDR